MRKTWPLALVLLVALAASLCVAPATAFAWDKVSDLESPYKSLSDLSGKRIGVTPGTIFGEVAEEKIDGVEVVYFNGVADLLEGLKSGVVDAIGVDNVSQYSLYKEYPNLAVVDEPLMKGEVAACFNKGEKGQKLCAEFNAFLEKAEADGFMDELHDRWCTVDYDKGTSEDLDSLEGENGTLVVYTDPTFPVVAFVQNGKLVGFDVDLLYEFCKSAGYKVQIETSDGFGCISAVSSGKADMAINFLNVTDERAEVIQFSEPYAFNDLLLASKAVEGSSSVSDGSGAEVNTDNVSPYSSLADMKGLKIGVLTGSVLDTLVEEKIEDAEKVYFSGASDMLQGLKSGVVDAIGIDHMSQYAMHVEYPQLAIVPESLDIGEVAACFSKDESGKKYCKEFNEFLGKIKSDGTLDELYEKWLCYEYDENPAVDFSGLKGENGTLAVYMDPTLPPSTYMKGDKITGFEVELIRMFCEYGGYKPEFHYGDVLTVVQAATTGKSDIALGCLNVTEERAKQILFSDPYVNNNCILGTTAVEGSAAGLSGDGADGDGEQAEEGPISFVDGFYRSFIEEDRWMLYLEGLGNTLLITLLSVIFGTALAVGFCQMTQSKRAWVRGIFDVLSKLSGGIPILVFLMVLFYIVFAKVNLPGVIVAAVGFSVYFGIDMGTILANSLKTVPQGQWEVCHVMGMKKLHAVRYVILPQVLRVALPQYKAQIVSLVKGTSIVGYITVQDLTRMSDIVRSRTFDAFMPLIFAAILYFVVVWIIITVFNRIELSSSAAKRIPKMGGIKLADLSDLDHTLSETNHEFDQVVGEVGEPIAVLEHVRKEYSNSCPLKDVSETIYRGDVISVIGPSGTGKTTLARMIHGLEPVTSGSVKVFDTVITEPGVDVVDATKRLNMVFQQFNLFPHLTIVENIMLVPVVSQGVSVQDAYANAMHLLGTVGLHSKAFNYPSELSGGQQQRAAIVRTLATNPDVIMFDEPTSALDPTSVDEILNVLGRLRKAGMTMMIITHDMRLAYEASTRIFYMDQGTVYEQGTPQEIFDNPQRRRTQHFIRQLKVWSIRIENRDFDIMDTMTSLKKFMRKYEMGLPIAKASYTQVELMLNNALELLDDDIPISVILEFSAKDRDANVCLAYGGPERKIMDEFDAETLELSAYYSDETTYEYTVRNEYVIDCNPHEELYASPTAMGY